MPSVLVNITDETAGGKITGTTQIEFPQALVTVAQIIEQRVRAEVSLHNARRKEVFQGFVQPSGSESTLNGFRQKGFRNIDADKQVGIAKKAFLQNGFFMLIDNLQAAELDQTFLLHKDSAISFVKLTPLVGG